MQIFLAWHKGHGRGRELDSSRVAKEMQKTFAPLFDQAPTPIVRKNASACVVYMEIPVGGWKPEYLQEDEGLWALGIDYPVDVGPVLKSQGMNVDPLRALPTLARALEADPETILRDMAPHFALVWANKDTGDTYIQTDGLGYAQVFEYKDQHIHAFTNKTFALKALGVRLEPDPLEWAVRFTLRWFPLEMTGIKRLRYFSPGQRIHMTRDAVNISSVNVIADWLTPRPWSEQECKEVARESLHNNIEAASGLWEKAIVGLTGGFDSRAILSILLARKSVGYHTRVRGRTNSADVVLARRLAKLADLDLRVDSRSKNTPSEPARLRECVSLAMLWQAGFIIDAQHRRFMIKRRDLGGGDVNIMGQYAEICRGFYSRRINADELSFDQFEEKMLDFMLLESPVYLRQSHRDNVIEILRRAYNQADAFGLEGYDRLDFFYLMERARRWSAGGVYSQPGKVVGPFMNPDLIRATYSFPGKLRQHDLFNRHIVETDMPIWAGEQYEEEFLEWRKRKKRRRNRKLAEEFHEWRKRKKRRRNHELAAEGAPPPPPPPTPDHDPYWDTVGKSLIDEALTEGGFWTEVFDPDLARKHWRTYPDALVLAHLFGKVLEDGIPDSIPPPALSSPNNP